MSLLATTTIPERLFDKSSRGPLHLLTSSRPQYPLLPASVLLLLSQLNCCPKLQDIDKGMAAPGKLVVNLEEASGGIDVSRDELGKGGVKLFNLNMSRAPGGVFISAMAKASLLRSCAVECCNGWFRT